MSEFPDIHSPEFRSVLFNHFLEIQGLTVDVQVVHDLIVSTSYQDLTPEIWAIINSRVPALAATNAYIHANLSNVDIFVDDPEAMDKVKEHVLKSMEKEQEDG